jgi:hypothetical protein
MKKEYNLEDLVPVFDDSVVTPKLPTREEETPIEEKIVSDEEIPGDTPEIVVDMPAKDDPTPEEGTPEAKPDEETPVSDEAAKVFYEGLVEKGIAPTLEKEEVTWDDVANVTNYYTEELPKLIQQEIVNQTPDLGKNLVDYVLTKRDSLTPDGLREFMTQHLSDVENSNVEINSIETAREIMKKDFLSRGFAVDEAEIMLDGLEDKEAEGKALIERAKALAEAQKSQPKSAQMLAEEKQAIETARQAQEDLLNNTLSEISNSQWNTKRKQQVQETLLQGQAAQVLATAARSPKGLMQLANLATYFDEKTGSFNFDDFIKQLESKPAESLQKRIQQAAASSPSTNTKSKEAPKRKSLLDELRPLNEF